MSSIFNYLHIKNECLGEAWTIALKKLRAHNTNANERTKMAMQIVLRDCVKQVTIQQNGVGKNSLESIDNGKLNRLIDALEGGEISEESIRACEVGKPDNQNEIGSVETADSEQGANDVDQPGGEMSA